MTLSRDSMSECDEDGLCVFDSASGLVAHMNDAYRCLCGLLNTMDSPEHWGGWIALEHPQEYIKLSKAVAEGRTQSVSFVQRWRGDRACIVEIIVNHLSPGSYYMAQVKRKPSSPHLPNEPSPTVAPTPSPNPQLPHPSMAHHSLPNVPISDSLILSSVTSLFNCSPQPACLLAVPTAALRFTQTAHNSPLRTTATAVASSAGAYNKTTAPAPAKGCGRNTTSSDGGGSGGGSGPGADSLSSPFCWSAYAVLQTPEEYGGTALSERPEEPAPSSAAASPAAVSPASIPACELVYQNAALCQLAGYSDEQLRQGGLELMLEPPPPPVTAVTTAAVTGEQAAVIANGTSSAVHNGAAAAATPAAGGMATLVAALSAAASGAVSTTARVELDCYDRTGRQFRCALSISQVGPPSPAAEAEAEAAGTATAGWRHASEGPYVKRNASALTGHCGCSGYGGGGRRGNYRGVYPVGSSVSNSSDSGSDSGSGSGSGSGGRSGSGSRSIWSSAERGLVAMNGGCTSDGCSDGVMGCSVDSGSRLLATRTTDRRSRDGMAAAYQSSTLVFPRAERNLTRLQLRSQEQLQQQPNKVLRPLQEGVKLSVASQQQEQKQWVKSHNYKQKQQQQQQQQSPLRNYPCGPRFEGSELVEQTNSLLINSCLQQTRQQDYSQQHLQADTQHQLLLQHHQKDDGQRVHRGRYHHQYPEQHQPQALKQVDEQEEPQQQQRQYFLVIFHVTSDITATTPQPSALSTSTPPTSLLPTSMTPQLPPSSFPHNIAPETAALPITTWATPSSTSSPLGSNLTASTAAADVNASRIAGTSAKTATAATTAAVVASIGGRGCASCRLYEAALDCLREGITITDLATPDYPIVYTNQAFLDMTGYGRHEVLGRNCRFLQGPDTDAAAVRSIRDALSARRGVNVTLANYTKTGTRFWNDLRLQPVAVSEGEPSGAATTTVNGATGTGGGSGGGEPMGRPVAYIGVQHDVSELLARKASEARLRCAKEAAESATEAKSQFLANMSHEIRTPLNGMIATAQLLLGSSLTPEQRELTETILDSGSALVGVLGDILDFSRIDHGSLEMQARPVCLRQTTEACIEFVTAEALKKGLAVAYLIDDAVLAAPLLGDPVRIRQVLANLLSNAVKFTERGEVVVRVTLERTADCRNPSAASDGPGDHVNTDAAIRSSSCTRTAATAATAPFDASGGAANTVCTSSNHRSLTPPPDADADNAGDANVVHFAVSDTGIGIDEESAPKLFQHFRQGSESMSRRYGGMGLGLAISKRLAQLMRGDVWVDSRRGAGSTFHFTLRAEWTAQDPGGGAWPPRSPAVSSVTTPTNSSDCTPRTSTDEGPASGPALMATRGVTSAAEGDAAASRGSSAAAMHAATVVVASSLYASSVQPSQSPLRLSSGSAGSVRVGDGRGLRKSPWGPDGTAGAALTPAVMGAVASSSLFASSSNVQPMTQPHRLSSSSSGCGLGGGGRELRMSPWAPHGTAKEAAGMVAVTACGGGGDSTVGATDGDSSSYATQVQPPRAQAASATSNTTCMPSFGSSSSAASDGSEERAALLGRTVLIDVSHGATSTQVLNSCRQLGIRAVQADACTASSPTTLAPATAPETPSFVGSPTSGLVSSLTVPAAAAAAIGPSSPNLAVTPPPPPVYDVLVVSTDRLMTALKAGWKGRPVVALGDRDLLPPAVQPLVVALAVPVRHSRLATALVKSTALLRWNGSSAPRLANTPIPCESIQTLKSWRLKRGMDWESINRRTSLDNSALERNNVNGRAVPSGASTAAAGGGAGAGSCTGASAIWASGGGSIISKFIRSAPCRRVSPGRQQQVPIPENAELSAVPGDVPEDQHPHQTPPPPLATTPSRYPYDQLPPPAQFPLRLSPPQPQSHDPTPPSPRAFNTTAATRACGGCEAVGAGTAAWGSCGVKPLQPLQPLRILIAEDNKVNQKVVLKVLQQILGGCQPPDVVENGLQVLAALQKKTYDLILMDIHMPEMDGLEASRRIQETYRPEDRPRIIALSADTVQTLHDRCREAGIEAFLVKPFRIEELARVMRTSCGARHPGGQTPKHLETDTAACGTPLVA